MQKIHCMLLTMNSRSRAVVESQIACEYLWPKLNKSTVVTLMLMMLAMDFFVIINDEITY